MKTAIKRPSKGEQTTTSRRHTRTMHSIRRRKSWRSLARISSMEDAHRPLMSRGAEECPTMSHTSSQKGQTATENMAQVIKVRGCQTSDTQDMKANTDYPRERTSIVRRRRAELSELTRPTGMAGCRFRAAAVVLLATVSREHSRWHAVHCGRRDAVKTSGLISDLLDRSAAGRDRRLIILARLRA